MRKAASFIAGLAMAVAVVGCNAYDKADYGATLTPGAVVPAPATTEATTGTFELTVNGPVHEWGLTVPTGLTSVTAVHIHAGVAGATQAGATLEVVLFDGPVAGATAPDFKTKVHGSYIAAQVTACATAPANAGAATCAAGRSLATIEGGFAAPSGMFVDVHTAANTSGALRGQIQ